jgi:hypothetical protein
MTWSFGFRQVHRWLSMIFTATVLAVTGVTFGLNEPPEWVYFVPLLPLALLMATGLYLFALPYLGGKRPG